MARGIVLIDKTITYDTVANGWTLSALSLDVPEQKTTIIDKLGGDGSWDLSTVLSDGEPRYNNRTLTATLERSDGTRDSRELKIRALVNAWNGMKISIEHPDKAGMKLRGRIAIQRLYSDLSHCAVEITVDCEPWLYREKSESFTLTSTATVITLNNAGVKTVCPTITLEGENKTATLRRGTSTATMTSDTLKWTALMMKQGTATVTISGAGTLTFTWEEGLLE